MVRSLFAGVTGMKAHQVRLDVIGNNVANVNTYGFKSSRATFRDVYYQSLRGAAGGSGSKGGLNPSQIGYGSSISSVDVMQTQAIKTTTGNPMDVSIAGEGFFQVMDGDGNIFYTKAGMLNIDDFGNLIDSNGCFILGTSGNPVGKAPGSSKITFAVPPVNPTKASATNIINNNSFTITSGQTNSDGNVNINILSGNLPANQKATATISSTGISVTLNSDEVFANIDAVQTAINDAIRAANGGKEHPGGPFTLTSDNPGKITNLTGDQIVKGDSGTTPGKFTFPAALEAYFKLKTTGENFNPTGPGVEFSIADVTSLGTPPVALGPDAIHEFELTVTVGGTVYTGKISSAQMATGGKDILLTNGNVTGDTITLSCPSASSLLNNMADQVAGANPGDPTVPSRDANGLYLFGGAAVGDFFNDPANSIDAAAVITGAQKSKNLGLGEKPFKLEKGTEGGTQTVGDLSGIGFGADGVVRATHSILGTLEIGRIDLAMFDNPSGLEQVGNTYFGATANSGPAKLSQPGTKGTGALAASSLELSNVDLSQEFADMITTQRGFQANSRIITVSDTLLEELINLKR